ncbi:MAG: translation initiation factor IF-2, partial [Verrucomicrobiales bacterium]|nr:translation initiation factor IF-2 [Verrucomicrobiales bacterium]
VRIYDIARKLGLESKFVLAKAKELGITHVKVASSTLDKITAEYLEEKLAPLAPAPGPSSTAAPEATHHEPEPAHPEPANAPVPSPEPAPVIESVAAPASAPIAEVASPVTVETPAPAPETAITAIPAPSHAAATTPAPVAGHADIPAAAKTEPAPVEHTHAPLPESTPAAPPVTAATAPSQPEVAIESATETPVAPSEPPVPPPTPAAAPIPAPVTPPAPAPVPAPLSPPPVQAVVSPPVAPPKPPAQVPAPPPTAPAPPPPAPPTPKVPGLGELVGRIELPTRHRPAGRGAPTPPTPPPPQQPPSRRPEPPSRGGPQQGRPQGFGGPNRYQQGGPGNRPAPVQQPPKPPTPQPGKTPSLPNYAPLTEGQIISLKPPIIVRDLAEKMGIKAYRLLHDLMELGVFANLNQSIDEKVAQFIAARHGFRFEVERREKGAGQVHAPIKKVELDIEDRPEELASRPPVITIMGHVDHGKTTLLDVIRKSNVAAREAGGITQHIGAYTIQVPHPERPTELQQLTFLDTPGHAAFSAMRARGANVTDIVILVVAASEGVMPQTVEALNHAKAAKVPIMVAVNKCDLPAANPLRTRQELQEHGLVPEEWGGETIYVDVSASTKKGVDQLLAMLVLQAEVMELKANHNRRAKGNVIESGLEPGGPTATVLVRKGTLKQGDIIICGQFYGRTRALISEEGQRLKEAGPSVAVKVLGLNGVPEAGLEFSVVENERVARNLAEERELQAKAAGRERGPRVTLENLLKAIEQQSAKTLKVVVKADTQGSVEAIVEALKKIDSNKVSLEIVHSAVGTITESDVLLAASAKGIIVGFHTRLDNGVPAAAKREGVQIKQYEIIYELIDEVRNAMAGLLDPELREVTLGSAEVRQIFDLSKGGRVAGCMVLNGRIVKGKARVVRRKEVIHDGILGTLRRYQDEVGEVRSGMECGIRVSSFDDFQTGDLIESYTVEKVAQQL